jgi:hypothetical protein
VISARNEKESPLLALPSELLNKILQGVVADQVVHILPEGSRKYKTRICASPEDCPTSESPRIHLALDDNTASDGMDDDSCYTLRHKECEHSATTKSGLNLDALLVCRQIYREASLLPFQQNFFVFGLHAPIEGPRPTMAASSTVSNVSSVHLYAMSQSPPATSKSPRPRASSGNSAVSSPYT